MIQYPIAKINLGLYVTEKRPDGYHNLETIFYPIPIHDTLQVEPAEEDSFELIGLHLDGDPMDNLVMKALRELRKTHAIPPVCVKLTKGIPSGAGMGGGSSDAAYMMKMLNKMFALGLTEDELEQRVSPLGADCTFFIKGEPVLATGIGNRLSPINLSLKGYVLVLVKPDDFVSTREAYALVKPQKPAEELEDTIRRPILEWKDSMKNDFENSVFANHPVIRQIKNDLYHMGADYALMSGSGSTVFALYQQDKINETEIREAFKEHFVYIQQLG